MTAGSYGQSFALKHLAAGRLEDALAEADRAIARDPDDPEPVLDRAQVLHAAGRFDEAAAAVLRAMELDRGSSAKTAGSSNTTAARPCSRARACCRSPPARSPRRSGATPSRSARRLLRSKLETS
jgi:tetratricopeptide (TPR) repeat protein